MDFKSEYYNENFIEEFVFSYGFKNEKLDQKETLNPNLNFQKYENNNLPISMNPMDYGKLINKISPIKNLNNKFITLDIETFIKDSILIVYCISIFDGKNKNSFILNDFKNSEELIINIKFNFGKKGEYEIYFRDSYLLLTASLKKLSQSFNVEDSKSIFPHLFVNENNLDYIGRVPDFKYFMDISKNDYNEYKASFNSN